MTVDTDAASIDDLLEAVRPAIFALCYRLVGSVEDAEDLTQESLIKMAQGYEGFEGRASFRTWAHRIATNTCYNFLTSARKRREIVVPDPLATDDSFLQTVDPDGDADDVRESLEFSFICVLQELSPLQRLVVVLRDVLGWSIKETADALGSAPAPVKNVHSRARKQLKKIQPRRKTLPPTHPLAESFMWEFAKAHIDRDMDACMRLYDSKSVVHAFPMDKYVGKKRIRQFYGLMLDKMPALFLGVKMNGNLAAACYHPTPDGSLERTGVTIVELSRPRRFANEVRISQVFWATQREHFKRVPGPDRMDEKPQDAQYLI